MPCARWMRVRRVWACFGRVWDARVCPKLVRNYPAFTPQKNKICVGCAPSSEVEGVHEASRQGGEGEVGCEKNVYGADESGGVHEAVRYEVCTRHRGRVGAQRRWAQVEEVGCEKNVYGADEVGVHEALVAVSRREGRGVVWVYISKRGGRSGRSTGGSEVGGVHQATRWAQVGEVGCEKNVYQRDESVHQAVSGRSGGTSACARCGKIEIRSEEQSKKQKK
ncbi:hypothetical protein PMAC_003010 [Pneumocystis sp. 'macacae']|nr:hypothetical protein PMAC_003010 [Pneumocystis sp. 'macacae']